jgi:hypothetical protein
LLPGGRHGEQQGGPGRAKNPGSHIADYNVALAGPNLRPGKPDGLFRAPGGDDAGIASISLKGTDGVSKLARYAASPFDSMDRGAHSTAVLTPGFLDSHIPRRDIKAGPCLVSLCRKTQVK